jgi:hypothetical protein
LKFITNTNWNKELNLFWMNQIQEFKLYHMHNCFKPFPLMVNNIGNHWLQWYLKENLIYELLILNNKHCNEHYPLSKW